MQRRRGSHEGQLLRAGGSCRLRRRPGRRAGRAGCAARARQRDTVRAARCLRASSSRSKASSRRSSRPAWIACSVPATAGEHHSCDGERGPAAWSPGTWNGRGRPGVPRQPRGPVEIAVFFRAEQGSRVRKIRVISPDCEIDAGGLPVHWLTQVKPGRERRPAVLVRGGPRRAPGEPHRARRAHRHRPATATPRPSPRCGGSPRPASRASFASRRPSGSRPHAAARASRRSARSLDDPRPRLPPRADVPGLRQPRGRGRGHPCADGPQRRERRGPAGRRCSGWGRRRAPRRLGHARGGHPRRPGHRGQEARGVRAQPDAEGRRGAAADRRRADGTPTPRSAARRCSGSRSRTTRARWRSSRRS